MKTTQGQDVVIITVQDCEKHGYFIDGEMKNAVVGFGTEGENFPVACLIDLREDVHPPHAVFAFDSGKTIKQRAFRVEKTPHGWAFVCPTYGGNCNDLFIYGGDILTRTEFLEKTRNVLLQ